MERDSEIRAVTQTSQNEKVLIGEIIGAAAASGSNMKEQKVITRS